MGRADPDHAKDPGLETPPLNLEEVQKTVPREGQGGHQQEFLHGKGGQALEGAAQGGLESPPLEVSKEQLEVALSALGWGQDPFHEPCNYQNPGTSPSEPPFHPCASGKCLCSLPINPEAAAELRFQPAPSPEPRRVCQDRWRDRERYVNNDDAANEYGDVLQAALAARALRDPDPERLDTRKSAHCLNDPWLEF
ncbi:hypothetical protein DUI87_31698 [Hirundo rustica rustica]|uniref:Uncharacterized protein n=1 Tax=Hirundo rustica rustica TaxID=333673 RepID=A0A3M0ITX7_HIRRU|nr:hypothetical protein DUI87_31698 [Hirundo rustica rustica]